MGKTKGVDVVIDPEGKWNFRRKRSSYIPHDRLTQDDDGEPGARQEFADECDINVLMRKYQSSGLLPSRSGVPQYGDFADLPDYLEAQNIIATANLAFAELPSDVRLRFANDPAEFVAFASDKANLDQMRIWGLAKPLEAGGGNGPGGGEPLASDVQEGRPTP